MVAKAHHRSARQGGFTLLETLVVLVIAAVLISIVPSVFSAAVPGAKFKAAVSELEQALEAARRSAIHSARTVDLVIDAEAGRYGNDTKIVQLPPGTVVRTLPGIGMANETRLSDTLSGPMHARFYPDGSSSGGIISLMRDGAHYVITVDWLTGRVDVSRMWAHADS